MLSEFALGVHVTLCSSSLGEDGDSLPEGQAPHPSLGLQKRRRETDHWQLQIATLLTHKEFPLPVHPHLSEFRIALVDQIVCERTSNVREGEYDKFGFQCKCLKKRCLFGNGVQCSEFG